MLTKLRRRIATTAASTTALAFPYIVLAQSYKPLGNKVTLESLIARLINVILGLTGTLALVMFIYSGFLWMTSGGNGDKAKKAKKNLLYSASGLVVIFGSYAVLRFIFSTVEGL